MVDLSKFTFNKKILSGVVAIGSQHIWSQTLSNKKKLQNILKEFMRFNISLPLPSTSWLVSKPLGGWCVAQLTYSIKAKNAKTQSYSIKITQ